MPPILQDASEEVLACDTPQGESAASLTLKIIKKLKFSSENRVSETVPNLQSCNDEANTSTLDVVSALHKVERAIKTELIEPLRTILRLKSKAQTKCDFLCSCLAHSSLPKGTTLCVPLKINDAPRDLVTKWSEILQNCGRQLTLTLINYHENQITEYQRLAEERITNGTQMILPEYITSVPNISVMIEDAIQDLLCEITVTTKRLRKRPPANSTPKQSKKSKTDDTITHTTNNINEPSTSKNFLNNSHSPKPAKNDQTPSKKTPWRPLKLKKKKN